MTNRVSTARPVAHTPPTSRTPHTPSLRRLVAIALFITAGEAGAQDAVGFRSGFTEGNGIPPRGRVELDYGTSVTDAAGSRGFTAGEVTAHVPLTRRFGMRLHFNSYTRIKTPQATVAGREDMGIGTAFKVRANVGWWPATALLTRIDVPSGSLPGQGNAWRPTAKVALAWQLPAGVTLASNIGVAVPGSHGSRFTQHFGSLWLGRGITERVGSFAEVFAFDREARTGPSTRHVRGGLTVLVTNSFHVDVNASALLGSAASRRSFGIGVKHRL